MKPVTVGELRKLLSKFPNDMQIAYDRWSDYAVPETVEFHS